MVAVGTVVVAVGTVVVAVGTVAVAVGTVAVAVGTVVVADTVALDAIVEIDTGVGIDQLVFSFLLSNLGVLSSIPRSFGRVFEVPCSLL